MPTNNEEQSCSLGLKQANQGDLDKPDLFCREEKRGEGSKADLGCDLRLGMGGKTKASAAMGVGKGFATARGVLKGGVDRGRGGDSGGK
ncbi:hypothetical protein LOK49_Contig25G00008 [Camellia lanceoleosa]|nr:hypothetical protein LOK49_Contig25G00008 [Camellia lanceoleosa]